MEKLREGNYYHIYNRGIDASDLFVDEENFNFFLRDYAFYTDLVFKTYAYCLMKNHFHLLVKVRSYKEQKSLYEKYRSKLKYTKQPWIPHGCKYKTFKTQTPSRQLAHLFSKYTKNFNSWHQRTGKLFEQPFKRKRVIDKIYLTHLVCYTHRNPIHHGVSNNFRDYPHSSYQIFLTDSNSLLKKEEVLKWFGGLKQFISAHREMKLKITPNLKIE